MIWPEGPSCCSAWTRGSASLPLKSGHCSLDKTNQICASLSSAPSLLLFRVLLIRRIGRALEKQRAQFVDGFAGAGVFHRQRHIVQAVNACRSYGLLPSIEHQFSAAISVRHSI